MYINTLPGMCIIVVEMYINIFVITNIWFHLDLCSMCKITQPAQNIMCKWIYTVQLRICYELSLHLNWATYFCSFGLS